MRSAHGGCADGIPLIRNFADDDVFAWRNGSAVSAAQFLHDVACVAAALPGASHLVNLCADRYRFTVGFAAALVRGQINLLPPNQTPDLFERLMRTYPDAYCLLDSDSEHGRFEAVPFPELAEAHLRDAVAVPRISPAQVAAIVLTSGSTGDPAPHPKTWGALVRSVLAECDRLSIPGARAPAILGTVPPQHMYGLESTVLLPMQGGLALHSGRPFYPADIRVALESLPRPRGLVTTPVHLRTLIAESPAVPPVDFIVCATAPLSPQLAAAAELQFAAPLHEIYGCTEAGQVATRRTVKTSEWTALPGVALRQNKQGETWIRGGHVTDEVLLNDVIELRSRSRFLLHGRKADLVNIAGKRTSLAHLNYHLNSIEGVRDGVFVVPDDAGESVTRLMALVVAPGVTRQALMKALRRRVDPAFLPRPLCFVDALPRNATSKLPREALATLMSELASRAA